MLRCPLRALSILTLVVSLPAPAMGQEPASDSAVVAEVREAVRQYDDALRRANTAAVGRFFAVEYVFVNARGDRLTRADRLANLRTGRTAFDALAHVPQEDHIRRYGDVVVYT